MHFRMRCSISYTYDVRTDDIYPNCDQNLRASDLFIEYVGGHVETSRALLALQYVLLRANYGTQYQREP